MIELNKTSRDGYWWKKGEAVVVDETNIESVEQMTDRTPSGSTSNAYVLITMRSGNSHKVYGDLYDIKNKLGL